VQATAHGFDDTGGTGAGATTISASGLSVALESRHTYYFKIYNSAWTSGTSYFYGAELTFTASEPNVESFSL